MLCVRVCVSEVCVGDRCLFHCLGTPSGIEPPNSLHHYRTFAPPPSIPLATCCQCARGVLQDPKEQLLLGPAYAIAKILKRNNLTIADIGVWELHEAFAGQVLANLNALNSDAFAKDSLKLSAKIGEVRWATGWVCSWGWGWGEGACGTPRFGGLPRCR
jgi:hypothetical protein